MFQTYFNPNNSLLIILQISLLFGFTPALNFFFQIELFCCHDHITKQTDIHFLQNELPPLYLHCTGLPTVCNQEYLTKEKSVVEKSLWKKEKCFLKGLQNILPGGKALRNLHYTVFVQFTAVVADGTSDGNSDLNRIIAETTKVEIN